MEAAKAKPYEISQLAMLLGRTETALDNHLKGLDEIETHLEQGRVGLVEAGFAIAALTSSAWNLCGMFEGRLELFGVEAGERRQRFEPPSYELQELIDTARDYIGSCQEQFGTLAERLRREALASDEALVDDEVLERGLEDLLAEGQD